MDTQYFAEEIVRGLEDLWYLEGRNPHGRKSTLHFDNAPMHDTRIVMGQMGQSELKKMEHPACSPDLAPPDFFPFGYIKEQLKGRSLAEE
jgi:hypothetical protein